MELALHPAAPRHLAPFMSAPGQADVLLIAMGIFLFLAVIGIGVFYFKLHALPEQMAHGGQKVQFEIVAVLALLALFTHNHAFWIAALLLALIPMPDFTTPLTSMADMAVPACRGRGRLREGGAAPYPGAAPADSKAGPDRPLS